MSFKCQDLPPGHSAGWRICLGDEIQKSALGDTMDASTLRTGPSGAALASASKASTEIPGGQRQRRSKNSKETRTVNTNKYKSINYQISLSFIYSNLSVLSINLYLPNLIVSIQVLFFDLFPVSIRVPWPSVSPLVVSPRRRWWSCWLCGRGTGLTAASFVFSRGCVVGGFHQVARWENMRKYYCIYYIILHWLLQLFYNVII